MTGGQVFTTSGGERYHSDEDCWGFKAGQDGSDVQGMQAHQVLWMTPAEAEAMGRTPCRVPGCLTEPNR
jgi:hypothetical protein